MKKIIVLILLLMMSMTPAVQATECEYALNAGFDSASDFKNGIALVSKDGQTAVIDMYGNIVIDFDERIKHIRSNGLIMIAGENDMAAFFDKNGWQLTDYIYDTYPVSDPKWNTKTYYFTYSLHEGDGKSELVPYSRNQKYGYINSAGIEVVPPIYGYADGFYNGVASISSEGILSERGSYTNGKYGLIKDTGEEILPANSYWVASMSYDYEYSYATNGSGAEVIADRYGNIANTDNTGYGKINIKYIDIRDAEGRIGVTDSNGNVVIPMDYYTGIARLNGDYFIVDNKIVNNKNEVIYTANEGVGISAHYISTIEKSPFARLSKEDESSPGNALYGLVNSNGEVIIEPIYRTCYDMAEGLIYAQDNEKNYLFDYSGKLLCILNGNLPGRCVNGLFPIRDFDTMKIGYMLNPITYPKVFINGARLISDVYPKIENDRTLVPLRAIMENAGADVDWDEETRTASVKIGEDIVTIKPGEKFLSKNGEAMEIDVPAKIENSRTLIPLRAIMEAFGYEVQWNQEKREVNIIALTTDTKDGFKI